MDIHEIVTKARNNSVVNSVYDMVRLARDSRRAFKKFDIKGSKHIFERIKEAHEQYGWYPDEYFLYHYDDLSDDQRASFIGEKEHSVLSEAMNSHEAASVLADKWETYRLFHDFFKREAIKVTCTRDLEAFNKLLKSKGHLIIKPLRGSFGKGIQIINDTVGSDYDYLLSDYPKGFIAEEVIEQDQRLGILHLESVNTLRIHTICYEDRVEVFHPYIRIGRGKSIVDNAGGGGIFTSCNPDTGEVLTVVDELGHSFTAHPDSGYPLIGYVVPCWDEAFKVAKQLAMHLPGLHYAGWDLALTKNGWVMVEGNPRAQMIFQISERKGFRGDMSAIMQKLNVTTPDVRFKAGRKTF